MKLSILLALCLVSEIVNAQDIKNKWTTTDTILEITSEVGIGCEWAQMCSPGYIKGIDAKIVGTNPSRRSINTYFIGWEIVHPVISYNLPPLPRHIFQGGTICFEVIVNQKNKQVGCVLHF